MFIIRKWRRARRCNFDTVIQLFLFIGVIFVYLRSNRHFHIHSFCCFFYSFPISHPKNERVKEHSQFIAHNYTHHVNWAIVFRVICAAASAVVTAARHIQNVFQTRKMVHVHIQYIPTSGNWNVYEVFLMYLVSHAQITVGRYVSNETSTPTPTNMTASTRTTVKTIGSAVRANERPPTWFTLCVLDSANRYTTIRVGFGSLCFGPDCTRIWNMNDMRRLLLTECANDD